MSFFDTLKNAAHTFIGYAAKVLGFIQKEAPVVADLYTAGLNYAEPLLIDIIEAEWGTAAGTGADAVLKNLGHSFVALKSVVYDWGVSGGFLAKLKQFATDIDSALTLGHIKNADAVAKAERIAKEIAALLANNPNPTPAA